MEANEVWIEMDNVEEGIVELIDRHDIRWLVMGAGRAAADEYYTEYVLLICTCVWSQMSWKISEDVCALSSLV